MVVIKFHTAPAKSAWVIYLLFHFIMVFDPDWHDPISKWRLCKLGSANEAVSARSLAQSFLIRTASHDIAQWIAIIRARRGKRGKSYLNLLLTGFVEKAVCMWVHFGQGLGSFHCRLSKPIYWKTSGPLRSSDAIVIGSQSLPQGIGFHWKIWTAENIKFRNRTTSVTYCDRFSSNYNLSCFWSIHNRKKFPRTFR